MRLLIVELEGDGHNMVLYTRLLLREAGRRGWDVSLLTTESGRRHPAYDIATAGPHGPRRTLVVSDIDRNRFSSGSLALMRHQLQIWKALRAASRANGDLEGFDLVYCINMDKFEKAVSLLGSPFGRQPFAGMLTNPKFHRAAVGIGPSSRADGIYRLLFARMLGLDELKCLTVIDEPFRRYCVEAALRHADKIVAVPDVGELEEYDQAEPARRRLGISESAFVVLLYGSLSRRKGIGELLRAVKASGYEDVVALVAGEADAETESLLMSDWCEAMQGSGNLVIRRGFHDRAAEAALFSAADAVWLGYVGGAYGSSGVLFQAGAAGLPVIAMDQGLIGWLVTEHEVGIALDPGDAARVGTAIRRLAEDADLAEKLGENNRRLAQQHTGAEFARRVCHALEANVRETAASETQSSAAAANGRQRSGGA